MSVMCKDCGLLAIRRKDSRELVEVEYGIRHGASMPGGEQIGVPMSPLDFMHAKADKVYVPRPFCFAMVPEIDAEAKLEVKHPGDREAAFQAIIAKPRDCDSFIPWSQGFTPKEHVEMHLLEKQEQRAQSRMALELSQPPAKERVMANSEFGGSLFRNPMKSGATRNRREYSELPFRSESADFTSDVASPFLS